MTSAKMPSNHYTQEPPLYNRAALTKVNHPCYCSSYVFPHRPGSGKCEVSREVARHRTGVVVRQCESLCQLCGQPADVETVDEGIGYYEFWGACGNDVRLVEATTCCRSNLEDNTMANKRLFKWYPPLKTT